MFYIVTTGVNSGKTEPIKAEPNKNRESGLDLVISNILNGCNFKKTAVYGYDSVYKPIKPNKLIN